MLSWYRKIQLLSLDVVLGACLMAYAIALQLEVSIPWAVYFCLGGAVWLVYTIDHLLDARQIQNRVVSSRHTFHLNNFNGLVRVWIGLLIAVLVVTINCLPIITIKFGLIASALVVIHLVLVKLLGNTVSIMVQKEFGVAVAYVVGVVVGPLSLASSIPLVFYFYMIQVFLMAFINLLEFSYFDKRVDQLQGQVSLSLILGREKLRKIILSLIFIHLLLIVYTSCMFGLSLLQVVFLAAWMVLTVIQLFPKIFIKHDYYRVFGDMVFMFPIILL